MKVHIKQIRVGAAALGTVQERSIRKWQRAVAPPSLEVLGSHLDRAWAPDSWDTAGAGSAPPKLQHILGLCSQTFYIFSLVLSLLLMPLPIAFQHLLGVTVYFSVQYLVANPHSLFICISVMDVDHFQMLCGVTGPGTGTCACFPKNWRKSMHVCQLIKPLNIGKASSCSLGVWERESPSQACSSCFVCLLFC